MSENWNALSSLKRLYDQIPFLREKQGPDGDFYQWYLDVVELLEKIFGRESGELAEFQQKIPLETDEERRLQIQQQYSLPPNTLIPQDTFYEDRLDEADAVLFEMIVILRQQQR